MSEVNKLCLTKVLYKKSIFSFELYWERRGRGVLYARAPTLKITSRVRGLFARSCAHALSRTRERAHARGRSARCAAVRCEREAHGVNDRGE